MMVSALKRTVQRAVPGPYSALQRVWQGRIDRQKRRIWQTLVAGNGDRVMQGPFAGLYYPSATLGIFPTARLLGSFESELHPVVERICATRYDTIIDVGCAEGYYAVGFALRMPWAQVYAYDIDETARARCAELARANGVGDRVHIGGAFDPRVLHGWATARTLLWSDCEGCEVDILRPDLAPEERAFDLIVELHDFLRPGAKGTIVERFTGSHDITIIRGCERDRRAYPALASLRARDQRLALSELRPVTMEWAVMMAQQRVA